MPLQVSIVTQEREVYSGEASFVLARAQGGDIGVLPGHGAFLASLHHDRLVITDTDQQQIYVAVHGGFIEVFEDRVVVLTGTAELAPEIDIETAQREHEEAKRALDAEDTPENRERYLRTATRVRTAAEAGLLSI